MPRIVSLSMEALTSHSCRVIATSKFTGKTHCIELPLAIADFAARLRAWDNREMMVQDAFPMLSPSQREFLMTGTTPLEWNEAFPEDDE